MSALLPSTFRTQRVEVDGVHINCALGGDGPPVLMLHGYPQTHLMWHLVAPALAVDHTVVLADLRGYGDSDKPTPVPGDENYSKRAMAHDQLGLMATLGFDRFALVGHDRGARTSHRLALDAPEAVAKLALLDIVPTKHVFDNVDRATATAYFHWFFLATGNGVPERLIGSDPEFWLRSLAARMQHAGFQFDPTALAEYIRCFSDPATVAATCSDYRAAAGIDLEHDAVTAQAGQTLACPTLVLWGDDSFVGRHYNVLTVWRQYASHVRGLGLPANHFLAEEVPQQTTTALREFLS
jgi:haloacetate dehalogenase